MYAVKMAFQSIQVGRPEAEELGQPDIHLQQRSRFEAVEATLCVYGGIYETSFAQHAQVFGYSRLGHTKLALDLSHRLFRRDQKAQYRSAARIGDDFKNGFHVFIYTVIVIYVSRHVKELNACC